MLINYHILVGIIISIHSVKSFQGVFWDVCDLHLNISFNEQARWINGQYSGDSPLFLIKSAFQHMKDVYPNPDFMIVNGDNFYHGDKRFMDSLQEISRELKLYFPNTILLPSLGNHDVESRNRIGPNSKWCETWFDIWNITNLNGSQSDIDNFKKGCFYARTIKSKTGPLTVMILNTLLWYEKNKLNQNLSDPFDQFLWIEKQLQKARIEKTKVFLMGHISPGSPEYSSDIIYNMFDHFNTRFLRIMQNYTDVIDAAFFAHQHTDAFKIVYDSDDKPAIPVFQAPSVTPFLLTQIGKINPSVRLYHWSDDSSSRRYDQYHAELSTGNLRQPNLNWTLEYTSTQMLPGLSAIDFNDLVKDFALDHSKHFDKFFKYHLSGQKHIKETCVPRSKCRCQFTCAMTNIDYSALGQCMKTCLKLNNLWWIILLSVVAALVLIIIIIIIICVILRKFRKNSASLIDHL